MIAFNILLGCILICVGLVWVAKAIDRAARDIANEIRKHRQ